jgi:hypothetical protein
MTPDPHQQPSGSRRKGKPSTKRSECDPTDHDNPVEASPAGVTAQRQDTGTRVESKSEPSEKLLKAYESSFDRKLRRAGIENFTYVNSQEDLKLARAGDKAAIHQIFNIAEKYMSALFSLATENPGVVKYEAQNRVLWPIPTSASNVAHDNIVLHLKKLNLAQPILFSARTSSSGWETSSNRKQPGSFNLLLICIAYK